MFSPEVKKLVRAALIGIFTIGSTLVIHGDGIRIGGSDLLKGVLPDIIEGYSGNDTFRFELDLVGSHLAEEKLRSGEVDLAIVALPEEQNISEEGIEKLIFSYQVAVLAVNKTNPIESISLKELRTVFGVYPDLTAIRWSELGLAAGWGLGEVQPAVLSDGHSISFALLKNKVTVTEFNPKIRIFKDKAQLRQNLLKNHFSLGVLPGLPFEKELKVLPVAEGEDHYAFEPSEQNIFYGDYPFRLPFYILYAPQRGVKDPLKFLLRMLYSDHAADTLRKHSFVPLPKNVREEKILNLDLGY